ncbi:MAG: tetratricopeptide repeat protein [Planctomycetota bacterium]|nr:tetratricopeptide repeat protein [Planctomycetota bacterium]
MADLATVLAQAEQLHHAGQPEQARQVIARALQKSPADANLNNAMAIALVGLHQLDQALFYAEKAASSRQPHHHHLVTFGNLLCMKDKHEKAMTVLQRALALSPGDTGARLALAHALKGSRRMLAASREYRAILDAHPTDLGAALALSDALQAVGLPEEAPAVLARALEHHPANPELRGSFAYALNYLPTDAPETILEAHRAFANVLEAAMPGLSHPAPKPLTHPDGTPRPMRVAILSADLRTHSVAFFARPLFEHLPKHRFTLLAYHTSSAEDAMSDKLRAHASLWRRVETLSPMDLARQIASDAPDVLIDLTVHTTGQRLAAVHLRPAPIIINYLGYPNTSGMPAFTHRIADAITDPPGTEGSCVERLERLAPSFLCFSEPEGAPDVAPVPASQPFTFGSFNGLPKVHAGVIDTWAEILRAAPGTRLIVKNPNFSESELAADIRARFERRGIDPARIDTAIGPKAQRDHLAFYNRVDLALDTFPYTGTTTTFESLLMGVPVLTMTGNTHASRVSASILLSLSLDRFIVRSREDYIARAVELAQSREALAPLRAQLRSTLRASGLLDAPAFAARFGELLESIHARALSERG